MGALLLSNLPSVYAAIETPGGSNDVPTVVDAEQAHFSVIVPTNLPIAVSSDGVVTTADDVKIVNNSAGPVVVTGLAVDPQNSWSLVDYDTDFGSGKVNEKKLGLVLQGNEVQTDGSCGLSGFSSIAGGTSIDFTYDANVAVQTKSISSETVANVVFTVGWDSATPPVEPGEEFTVTYIAGENGSVNESSRSFESGAYITFPDTTPSEGYVFDKWVDNDTELDVTGSTTVNADMTVKALFKPEPVESFTVTYISGGNGIVNEDSRVFDKGSNLTFPTTTPSEGYIFDKWVDSSTGSDVSGSTIVNSEMTVKALFVPKPVESFTVNYISDGNGTVGESSRVFKDGSKLTFPSTTPNTGYTFTKWVNSSTNEDVTTSTVVKGSITVKAVFEKQTFIVTYVSDGNGSVGESSRTFKYGDKLTFPTTTPSDGYILDKWVDSDTELEVTDLSIVNNNMTVKALFKNDESKLLDYYTFKDDTSNTGGWRVGLNDAFKTALNKQSPSAYKEWKPGDPLPALPSTYQGKPVTSMYRMFYDYKEVTSLNLSNFDTSNVTNMGYMFWLCNSLTYLNLSSFDTSNVTNMECMFQNCGRLSYLNLSNFDTSNVTNMENMFLYCRKFTSLNLSNFNTSKVTNMKNMFSGCYKLTSLNLSSFDTSNVTDMSNMFSNCDALVTAYGRTQEDCNRLNGSTGKPSNVKFVVKS